MLCFINFLSCSFILIKIYQYVNLGVSLIIFIGATSNFYLTYVNQKTQLSDRVAFNFLLIDILQLSSLIYLTGGIANPFIIFLIIPSFFSSSNLSLKTNLVSNRLYSNLDHPWHKNNAKCFPSTHLV